MRIYKNVFFRYPVTLVCAVAVMLVYKSYNSLPFRKREPAQNTATGLHKLTGKESVLRALIEQSEAHRQEWIKHENLTATINKLNDHSYNSTSSPSAIIDLTRKSFKNLSSDVTLKLMLSNMKEKTPVTPVPVAPRHKVNIDGFNDLLLPRVCGRSKPHFIAFVTSAPRNSAQRQTLRETWANTSAYPPGYLEVMFVVGRAAREDDALRRQLLTEWQTHGDLLYTDFIDSYGNLTYKTLVTFRFVVKHCSGTPYVIKADDDTVVNVPALHERMLRYRPSDILLDCYVHLPQRPARTMAWPKWIVTYEEVPLKHPDLFPTFCSGGGVASTYATIKAMYSHVAQVPWLRLEDVYTLGYLAEKIRPPVQFHPASHRFGADHISKMLDKPDGSTLFFVFQVGPKQLVSTWDVISKVNLGNGINILKLNSSSTIDFWNLKLFQQT